MQITDLFNEKGMCIHPPNSYFDEYGDLEEDAFISEYYTGFRPDSDIVKMYYASQYASETHGNYTASTLFMRTYPRIK